jgi:hypothetical protein
MTDGNSRVTRGYERCSVPVGGGHTFFHFFNFFNAENIARGVGWKVHGCGGGEGNELLGHPYISSSGGSVCLVPYACLVRTGLAGAAWLHTAPLSTSRTDG